MRLTKFLVTMGDGISKKRVCYGIYDSWQEAFNAVSAEADKPNVQRVMYTGGLAAQVTIDGMVYTVDEVKLHAHSF